jgi:magnesium transporter
MAMAAQRRLDLVLDSVRRFLRMGATANLLNLLQKQRPSDLAFVLGELTEGERSSAFAALVEHAPRFAMEVASELDPEAAAELLARHSAEDVARLLQELPPDDAAAIADHLPDDLAASVLPLIAPDRGVSELLEHPEQTAGRIMNPNVFALTEDMTAGEAIAALQAFRDVEVVFYVYVIDSRRHLVGVVSLRQLLLVAPATPLKQIMTPDVISVDVDTDQEEVARQVASYNLLAIPVVDAGNKLVGTITVDDVIDVLKDEATEDVYRGAGVGVEIDYPRAGVRTLYRKRIGWLLILLIADFLSSSVIAFYQSSLEAVVALAFFIPMLIDSGGNTGTQSATLVIRGLSTGQLAMHDWLRILRKELGVGLLLGGTLGLAVYLRGFFWRGGPEVALVVALTMIALVFWANLVGAVLPIVLKRARLDPAVVSSPFITTAVDVTGLLIYFNIARVVLGL